MREKEIKAASGFLVLVLAFVGFVGGIALVGAAKDQGFPALGVLGILVWGGTALVLGGLFVVNPYEARVLQLFGRYVGTVKEPGLRWASPFYSKRRISLRVRNFETEKIKVNDVEGNPIEIAAIVVWKVVDSAEACFLVDDYVSFMRVQSEAAVRNLATHYPYDAHDDSQVSLRANATEIAEKLRTEIQERLAKAGMEVIESRLAHLAYAPEIAQAMLQRQQAGAIIAARTRIVEGAVGMVQMALEQLAKNNIVELDGDRKAAMVSNLLVVLCGERGTQPVLNTGTIYQ
jgi:regulator of protease activity HflC (stomatin/prohibitin superfamily)